MNNFLVRLLLLSRWLIGRQYPPSENLSVLLLHTNDIHANYQEVNKDEVRCEDESHLTCFGGVARIRSAVDYYKREAAKKGIPTIYLDAGDIFQGSVFYTDFKWSLAAKMVNMLGIHVMSLGNHEFDDKVKGVVPFIEQVKIPIVCCNIDSSEEPSLNLMPSTVLTVKGRKIGIIGYLTPDISERNRGKLKILDEITSIRAEAQKLLNEGVNILIALGHSGYEKDQEIAKEVEEIDVVVGGHTHTFLYTGIPPSDKEILGSYPTEVIQASGKIVPVVQAASGSKYLGYLNLEFDSKGNLLSATGQPKLLTGNMPQSSVILKTLHPYQQKVICKYRKLIGSTEVLLEGRIAICKLRECNIGNMITDAYVEYVAKNHLSPQGWPLAAIGIIHSGAIKASLNPKSEGYSGNIVLEDVMTVLPFASELVILQVPGNILWEALEHAVKRYQPGGSLLNAYLLQVSGLLITYDLSRVAGNRLLDVQVRCAECVTPSFSSLDLHKTYGVVMPKFIAQGGDNYFMFQGLHQLDLKVIDYTVVSEYIANYSPLRNRVDGRIKIHGLSK